MSLFQLSHHDDPFTSKLAILKLTASGVRKTHLAIVLEAVASWPLLTACELKKPTGLTEYQVRRRLTDLKNRGQVARCAARRCTVKGSMMSTWEIR